MPATTSTLPFVGCAHRRRRVGRLEALENDYDIEAISTPSRVTHLTFTRKAVS